MVDLDPETSERLVQLFDVVGNWVAEGGDESCQVYFGSRPYTLLAASEAKPNDPTQFLLERSIQLQTALDTRIVIEQAKGVLAERFALSVDDAFELLRRAARSTGTRIHDMAQQIVSSPETPEAVEKARERG